MRVASGLASGPKPLPELASAAVRQALAKADLTQAGSVLLFLTRDFHRQPQAALLAAARAAGCMEIFGCTAYGLITEDGWLLDQSGAAALVIESLPANSKAPAGHQLSFTGHSTLPFDWQAGPARAGLLDNEAAVWAHGRQINGGNAEIRLPGFNSRLAISTGLHLLSEPMCVDASQSYDVRTIGGMSAVDSLRRKLPGERRQALPLHNIVAVRDAGEPGIAILAANDDGSLTLAEAFQPGDMLSWAIRQPLFAELDMADSLSVTVNAQNAPDFAVMFSCIGRGPLFYGNDDRDLRIFREKLPNTPLIGAYGSGQIAPCAGRNRLFQNSVMTLLFENNNV
jgi:small ligand-binding sensory domain FIST